MVESGIAGGIDSGRWERLKGLSRQKNGQECSLRSALCFLYTSMARWVFILVECRAGIPRGVNGNTLDLGTIPRDKRWDMSLKDEFSAVSSVPEFGALLHGRRYTTRWINSLETRYRTYSANRFTSRAVYYCR